MAGNISTREDRGRTPTPWVIMGDGDGTGNSIAAASSEYTEEFQLTQFDLFSVEIVMTDGTANFDAVIQFEAVNGQWIDDSASGEGNATLEVSSDIVTAETNSYVLKDLTIPFWRGKCRILINNDDDEAAEFIVRLHRRKAM